MTDDLFSRKGRFTLSRSFIEDIEDELLFDMFEYVIVLRADDKQWWTPSTEYFAVSPYFEVVSEGCVIPEYIATINTDDQGVNFINWEKVK